ncbi:UNVERIFIED_CONTAM: hypothetical protein FKN15_038172 [Acipenser sinensis]
MKKTFPGLDQATLLLFRMFFYIHQHFVSERLKRLEVEHWKRKCYLIVFRLPSCLQTQPGPPQPGQSVCRGFILEPVAD